MPAPGTTLRGLLDSVLGTGTGIPRWVPLLAVALASLALLLGH